MKEEEKKPTNVCHTHTQPSHTCIFKKNNNNNNKQQTSKQAKSKLKRHIPTPYCLTHTVNALCYGEFVCGGCVPFFCFLSVCLSVLLFCSLFFLVCYLCVVCCCCVWCYCRWFYFYFFGFALTLSLFLWRVCLFFFLLFFNVFWGCVCVCLLL